MIWSKYKLRNRTVLGKIIYQISGWHKWKIISQPGHVLLDLGSLCKYDWTIMNSSKKDKKYKLYILWFVLITAFIACNHQCLNWLINYSCSLLLMKMNVKTFLYPGLSWLMLLQAVSYIQTLMIYMERGNAMQREINRWKYWW